MSNIFKDFDLVKGTGMKAGIAGAGALFNGYQAIRAKVDYGNKMIEIKNYDDNRQKITNVFGQIENPYKNLAVATQAAEIKMEQTDQALANTLDTLRETGAASGGATAIANAALKSKQGVAASIEQQEVNNQKLQAQGQLQVDIAKGKGEIQRMEMQETRDVEKLDRLQSQADVLRAQSQSATLGAIQGLTNVGNTLIGGMTAADLPDSFMNNADERNNAAQNESERDFQERMENSKINNSSGDDLKLADEIIDSQPNTQEAYAKRLKQAQEARIVDQDINPNNKTFDEAYTSLNPQPDSTKPAFTFEEYVDNKLWNNDNLVAYFKKNK